METVDNVFKTQQRPTRRKAEPKPRKLSRFEVWAWSPITAFRVGLTVGYLWLIYLGISAYVAGIPTFDLTAPRGWTPIWATVVSLSAATAAIGSISDRRKFHNVELIGSWGLTITLGVSAACIMFLAYAAGDQQRVVAAAAYTAIFFPPCLRMIWLMSQLGRRRAVRPVESV